MLGIWRGHLPDLPGRQQPAPLDQRPGLRRFGAITMHVWLLRLAFVAAYGVFFVLPVMLAQDVAPAMVRGVASSGMGHWLLLLTLACSWR